MKKGIARDRFEKAIKECPPSDTTDGIVVPTEGMESVLEQIDSENRRSMAAATQIVIN